MILRETQIVDILRIIVYIKKHGTLASRREGKIMPKTIGFGYVLVIVLLQGLITGVLSGSKFGFVFGFVTGSLTAVLALAVIMLLDKLEKSRQMEQTENT